MTELPAGIRYLDLGFLGMPMVIATAVVEAPDGIVLVDPGPSSCLAALYDGLDRLGVERKNVNALLLTHIHLDHAGASGSLVRDNPWLKVFVHERGAPHMIDPSRLLDSAKRLYGDEMDRMWGEFLPVPGTNIHVLKGSERIDAAGRRYEVAYTPGHASHHVSYFDASAGLAFVGDTAGVRIGSSSFNLPPTPPPDIDLAAWNASLDRILAWRPEILFLTHFGPTDQPPRHIADLRSRLDWTARIAHDALVKHPDPAQDAAAIEIFRRETGLELRRHVSEDEAGSYEMAVPLKHCYLGLARYWRKQGAAGPV